MLQLIAISNEGSVVGFAESRDELDYFASVELAALGIEHVVTHTSTSKEVFVACVRTVIATGQNG